MLKRHLSKVLGIDVNLLYKNVPLVSDFPTFLVKTIREYSIDCQSMTVYYELDKEDVSKT